MSPRRDWQFPVGLTITGIEDDGYEPGRDLLAWPQDSGGVMVNCDILLDDGSRIHGPPLMWVPKEDW